MGEVAALRQLSLYEAKIWIKRIKYGLKINGLMLRGQQTKMQKVPSYLTILIELQLLIIFVIDNK